MNTILILNKIVLYSFAYCHWFYLRSNHNSVWFWHFTDNNAGILKKVQGLVLKWRLILSCLVFMIEAGENHNTGEPPSLYDSRPPLAFVVVHDQPLPANLHVSKHVLSHGAPIAALSPVNPPSYGPFISNDHSPTSSHLSIPFKKKSEMKPPISGFKDVAPVHSTAAAGPSALAQPPLSPYASSKSSLFFPFLIDG